LFHLPRGTELARTLQFLRHGFQARADFLELRIAGELRRQPGQRVQVQRLLAVEDGQLFLGGGLVVEDIRVAGGQARLVERFARHVQRFELFQLNFFLRVHGAGDGTDAQQRKGGQHQHE